MYVKLMKCRMKTKFVLAIDDWCLTIRIENGVNFKWAHTCSFHPNLCSNKMFL